MEKESTKQEFEKADKKFDKIFKKDSERVSNVELRDKVFMKISDVSRVDAQWFKQFADKHTDGKQFLAIKVLRAMAEKEHLYRVVEDHEMRLRLLENPVVVDAEDEPSGPIIPKTQGNNKNGGTQ